MIERDLCSCDRGGIDRLVDTADEIVDGNVIVYCLNCGGEVEEYETHFAEVSHGPLSTRKRSPEEDQRGGLS